MAHTYADQDHVYMRQALAQARRAYMHDEVPVGAVIVDANDCIVGRGYNQTIKKCSPLAHAEIIAITRAARALGDWRLTGCSLYVTVEPCSLCMQVVIASRLSSIIYGASSPRYGFLLDKHCNFDLYKTSLVVRGGVCAAQAYEYMRHFFKQKRGRDELWQTDRRPPVSTCKSKKRTS